MLNGQDSTDENEVKEVFPNIVQAVTESIRIWPLIISSKI